jgi:hypothetical protein
MPDIALLLQAPDGAWAAHIETLVQQALGEKGSVQFGDIPRAALPGAAETPGFVVTGIIVCDEPESEMLDRITAKLVDIDESTGPRTIVSVKPVTRA